MALRASESEMEVEDETSVNLLTRGKLLGQEFVRRERTYIERTGSTISQNLSVHLQFQLVRYQCLI
jgi:hypothetical protein